MLAKFAICEYRSPINSVGGRYRYIQNFDTPTVWRQFSNQTPGNVATLYPQRYCCYIKMRAFVSAQLYNVKTIRFQLV